MSLQHSTRCKVNQLTLYHRTVRQSAIPSETIRWVQTPNRHHSRGKGLGQSTHQRHQDRRSNGRSRLIPPVPPLEGAEGPEGPGDLQRVNGWWLWQVALLEMVLFSGDGGMLGLRFSRFRTVYIYIYTWCVALLCLPFQQEAATEA